MSVHEDYIVLGWLFEPGTAAITQLVAEHDADQAVSILAEHPLDPALLRRELRLLPTGRLWDQARRIAADPGRAVTPVSADWPDDLGPDQPLCLWARGPGRIPQPGGSITVSGSRACTAYGSQVAAELGHDLADRGREVVADGGFGIASAALRGALTTSRPPIAVIPAGLDRLYPAGQSDLLTTVAAEGLLLSAYPAGATCTRSRSTYNRRLLAALTGATVLVEAVRFSSVLETARNALHLGRPTFIVPGPITSDHSRGCLALLRDDLRTRPIGSAADILTDLQAD
ncbi:DNA-processing protein DprA [Actinoplanes sp. L3-i22]|uniref:DNA-processing protein DprA n=1 Tax=Actinoplanes sp. L3-i22 TaxID=2836373 RepID=UPI001C75852B|nr:DNA-processing protein DprA [Actinoplanes sp. L3-i22]BCY08945.1 hypothetical protein L3i22_040330 [Actinoplanes sp. L3-i22]